MRSLLPLALVLPLALAPLAADPPPPAAAAKHLFVLPEGAFASQREPFTASRQVPGITAERVRFPSPVVTKVERNNTVHGIYFTPRTPTDRAVLILPWWKGHDEATVEVIGQAFASAGFNALFAAMGYQMQRAPEGRGSGSAIMEESAEHVQEWMRQAALDARRAHQWLATEGKNDPNKIGIVGISLGGFIAGLTYGVAPEFKAAGVILAGGNLGHYIAMGARLGIPPVAEGLAKLNIAPDEIERVLAPYDPVTYADPARKDGLMIVCGLLDPIVPYPVAADLWNAYGRPRILRLPTGHVTTVALVPLVLAGVISHLDRQLK